MTRRALLVGIDDYDNVEPLSGAASDARAMAEILSTHEDGSRNFDCRILTSPGQNPRITRGFLRTKIEELFSNFPGDVLFYFSGHGAPTMVGGHLMVQDGTLDDPGIPMNDLLTIANRPGHRSALLILDCCFSGSLGNPTNLQSGHLDNQAQLREGVTILAASRPTERAREIGGHGVFTELVVGALKGGAADVRGMVSAASIYGYVEAALGAWDQRPLYKSHASNLAPVRKCEPSVPDALLRELPRLFPAADARIQLDPTFEETNKAVAKPENVAIFKKLKKLQTAGLIKNVSGDDLYWTAERSGAVYLTPLGQFYRRLAADGRI